MASDDVLRGQDAQIRVIRQPGGERRLAPVERARDSRGRGVGKQRMIQSGLERALGDSSTLRYSLIVLRLLR